MAGSKEENTLSKSKEYHETNAPCSGILRAAAETHEERYAIYGDNYKRFGTVMQAMFPDEVVLSSVEDFNRMGIFVQLVSKMTRYAEQFENGGHQDSAHDMVVYAAMLEELTE